MKTYVYQLTVEEGDDGTCVAFIDDRPTPLRGCGTSPLEAVRNLCEAIKEWPIGGADRWLSTDDGVKLARKFVPGFEPGKSGGTA